MADITISADTSKAVTFLNTFPRETSKAMLRALRRGTKSAATRANRAVSRDMGIKVGDARKRIRVTEPTSANLTGELRADLERIPLIEFRARGPEPSRGRGRGVTYRIGRAGRGRAPHAFIETIGGRRGVHKRVGTARTPTTELHGPSIGHVFAKHDRQIAGRGQQVFEAEFDRLLDRILSGFGGRIV